MSLGNNERCCQLEKDAPYSRGFISICWDILIIYCHLLENHCNECKTLHCLQYDWNPISCCALVQCTTLPTMKDGPEMFTPFTPSFCVITFTAKFMNYHLQLGKHQIGNIKKIY